MIIILGSMCAYFLRALIYCFCTKLSSLTITTVVRISQPTHAKQRISLLVLTSLLLTNTVWQLNVEPIHLSFKLLSSNYLL